MTDLEILLRLDALDAGDIRLFSTTDGKAVGVSLNASIKDDAVLISTGGYGATAADALADLWDNLTNLKNARQYVIVNTGEPNRRAVRWNGGAWKTVHEPARQTA